MTLALMLTSITDAISQLSITGVTVRDYDGIANNWIATPNVLYINPEQGVVFNPPQYPTLNRGLNAPMDISYTINYRFLGTQIGDGATLPVNYAAMMDKVIAIYQKIADTDTPYSGKVYMELGRVAVGARADPAGNMYNGADFAIVITEQHN